MHNQRESLEILNQFDHFGLKTAYEKLNEIPFHFTWNMIAIIIIIIIERQTSID